jgi:hypothetical protein
VRCSLLTLSTFIDDELPPERRAEVDAHLVGCPRCTSGVATLREEKARVGQLARVHVDPESAQSMLEQVGITLDGVAPPATPGTDGVQAAPPSAAEQLPWQSGRGSASLPWTPRRPVDTSSTAELPSTDVVPDLQPDLPLDGVRSSPAFWDRTPSESSDAVPSPMEDSGGADPDIAAGMLEEAGTTDVTDAEWLGAQAPSQSWETDLPPPLDAPASDDASWGLDQAPTQPLQPPPAPPLPPVFPVPTQEPTRLAAAAGPAAVWSRIRDAVTVRLALSRNADAVERSMQIVSGAPIQRGAQLTQAAAAPPEVVALPASDPPAATAAAPAEQEVELEGLSRASKVPVSAYPGAAGERNAVADRRPSRWRRGVDDGDRRPPADEERWNAFAASSYPIEDDAIVSPPATPPRPLGRHSRAVARERIALSTRVWRAMAAMAAAVQVQGRSAVAVVRRRTSGISQGGPDNRLLAGVAAIGLIFVIALLVGHSSKSPPPAVARTAPSAAVAHPKTSAPAQSSGTAQAIAPSTIPAQTFGSGAGGFQVTRLRYGVQPSHALRVVFDLGAVSGTVHGSPKVVVSFTNPKTMLVTFSGTLPSGSTGVPPPGRVISSVTLVSSGSQTTVYRFVLTRAVTTSAFYLLSPTRFVLDLH